MTHSELTNVETHQQLLPGLTPPPTPRSNFLFKMQMRKHFKLAAKRKRYAGAIWSSVFNGGLAAGMYFIFTNTMGDQPWIAKLIGTSLYALFLTFGVNGAFQSAYVELVGEKESKMKIVQNIYGLTDVNYWLSWLMYFMVLSLPCILILLVCTVIVAPIFRGTNILIVIIIMMLAFMNQFLLIAVGSVFFNSVKGAQQVLGLLSILLIEGATAAMIWVQGQDAWLQCLINIVPMMNVVQSFNSLAWAGAGVVCVGNGKARSCHNGLGFGDLFSGEACLIEYDNMLDSLEANCLAAAPFPFNATNAASNNFGVYKTFLSPGICFVTLLLAVLVFMLFTWWLDNIWQGEYGTAKPLTFCLNPSYMCPKRQISTADPELGMQNVALSIRYLRKEFKGQVAVNDMSLEMYGGEIFAMLGHNGAGKTTAINCVVGLIPPSSGDVTVNGFDVKTQIDAARRQMSICPQDNPMYEEYTVREHLMYFSSLRGVAESTVTTRIGSMLGALGLSEKVDDLCKNLSGGQKRRLWVATALIGESPIVFLDEPTSGMDPASRRELWDLLIQMKMSGRCVIFTTHYLEEADLLADRKCVLARGTVQAVGTSRELKNHFGDGYHLVVEMASGGNTVDVEKIVTGHISQAKKEMLAQVEGAQAQDQAAVITERFTIPFTEMDNAGAMLTELEQKRHMLGVRDYTLETTSLEEVFMKLGKKVEAERQDGGAANVDFGEVQREEALDNHRPETSTMRAIVAMVKLKYSAFRSGGRQSRGGLFGPCLFIVLAFVLSNTDKSNPQGQSYAIALYPSLAFGVAALGSCLTSIRNNEKKVKYVMLVQGVRPLEYWVGTLMAELIMLEIPVAVFLLMFFVSPPPGIGHGPAALVIMMAILFPINVLLFCFNVSSLFHTTELAVKVLPLCFMLLGMIPCALVWVFITFVNNDTYVLTAEIVHVFFSFVNPLYNLGGMLIFISQKYNGIIDSPLTLVASFGSWAAIPLYAMPFQFLLYCGNLIRLDMKGYNTRPGDFKEYGDGKKDDDVMSEQRRIEKDPEQQDGIEAARYQGLSHTYRTKTGPGRYEETPAVRGISLGVKPGECFGLLGPNGAGKTTTLGVLTGDVRPPTAGQVTIFGHEMSTKEGMEEAYKLLGVCPQLDPLMDEVTGRDHLLFFGRIKGVPEVQLFDTVDKLLARLGLDQFDAMKKAGEYSGGMKRKLSVGIALIGHSKMLFLDEPSAAVDAGAKRHLWKVIKNRASDQTVVLTTHSMEEAEALCDRLAIQVKGQLRCLGTPMHIRNKYGNGYQLEIFSSAKHDGSFSRTGSRSFKEMAKNGPSPAVLSFVSSQISHDAKLLEFHGERYLFQLPTMPSRDLTLGKVLTQITLHRQDMSINDWSIERPTLEQVFLKFAREQDDVQDDEHGPKQ